MWNHSLVQLAVVGRVLRNTEDLVRGRAVGNPEDYSLPNHSSSWSVFTSLQQSQTQVIDAPSPQSQVSLPVYSSPEAAPLCGLNELCPSIGPLGPQLVVQIGGGLGQGSPAGGCFESF